MPFALPYKIHGRRTIAAYNYIVVPVDPCHCTARRGAHHGPVIIHVVPDSAWECRMYVPSLLSVIELRSAVFGDERDNGDSYRLSGDDVPGGTYLELS